MFYDFDTPMTTEILFKIIACIHEVGFEVVALVSDMGPTNIGLWKSLNITPSSPSFINPVTLKNIHVFADVPHLLKLIRNHFIDRGFIFSNNTYIGRQIIEEYLSTTKNSDFKLAYKITEKHLNVMGTQRQNVKLAAQLFSNTMSTAIKYCGEKSIIKNNHWEQVIKYFCEKFVWNHKHT